MPNTSVEQLGKRVEALQKSIAAQGEGTDAATKRRLSKQLKRAQRKRRRLSVEAERVKAANARGVASKEAAAAKAAGPAKAAAPAEAAPAEETPAE